jgi:exosortase/archaeosortase family protein
VLLNTSTGILNLLGFSAICNNYDLLVAGRGSIQVVYSCLGLGVSSFFAAFVLAYPQHLKAKIIFIICGILTIEILNVLRFVLLALFWNKADSKIIDHHTIFNIIIYALIAISLYFWVKSADKDNNTYAAN